MQIGLNEVQKASITETLFALTCLLNSDGRISVAIPLVDDEGIDLLVYKSKASGKVLFIQVKSRFTLTGRGRYRSQVRKKSFIPRKDLYLAFVYFNKETKKLGEIIWFIPSLDFIRLVGGQGAQRKIYVFHTKFTAQNDMWAKYKFNINDISQTLLQLLQD